MPAPAPIRLTPQEARRFLVGHLGLRAALGAGDAGIRATLGHLRHIQLDPIDRIGTNPDLVAHARVDGLRRGDVFRALLPGHAFEHWAKERCLLPASYFPYYRDYAREVTWWRTDVRRERLPPDAIDRVLAEVTARGPLTPDEVGDHGAVEPLDWSGWKGTSKVATMAMEVLWTQAQVVVVGRHEEGQALRHSLPGAAGPRRALTGRQLPRLVPRRARPRGGSPDAKHRPAVGPADGAPQGAARRAGRGRRPGERGGRRAQRYLAPAGTLDAVFPEDDGRMRILGPLDPLLWDRRLVNDAFGFDYIWEVYKPAEQREVEESKASSLRCVMPCPMLVFISAGPGP